VRQLWLAGFFLPGQSSCLRSSQNDIPAKRTTAAIACFP
jgi:hypothetical protein